MPTSITASNSSSPFNGLLLSDAAFSVSQSWGGLGGITPIINFGFPGPWPTTNRTQMYVYSTAPSGTSTSASYLTIQESTDNVTWKSLGNFSAPLTTVYGGTAYAGTFSLQLKKQQYLRLSGSLATGSSAGTGSSAPIGTFGLGIIF